MVCLLRVAFQDEIIPYPIAPLRGWLLLAGMNRLECERVLDEILTAHRGSVIESERDLIEELKTKASGLNAKYADLLEMLFRYEALRREGKVPPLTLMIEGASATGKSMVALMAIELLAITRIISTDTVRQLLRTRSDESIHPELFVHTYQAYEFRQEGAKSLSPVVRGYLAQCQLMREDVSSTIQRILGEGIHSIFEGVHIEPSRYSHLSQGLLEILVDPSEETHRSMFLTKLSATGLRSVQGSSQQRLDEFSATREIQYYLRQQAESGSVARLGLDDYRSAALELAEIVMKKIRSMLQTVEDK